MWENSSPRLFPEFPQYAAVPLKSRLLLIAFVSGLLFWALGGRNLGMVQPGGVWVGLSPLGQIVLSTLAGIVFAFFSGVVIVGRRYIALKKEERREKVRGSPRV